MRPLGLRSLTVPSCWVTFVFIQREGDDNPLSRDKLPSASLGLSGGGQGFVVVDNNLLHEIISLSRQLSAIGLALVWPYG